MKRTLLVSLPLLALAFFLFGDNAPSTGQMAADRPDKKFEPFDNVVKGAKEYDGLFRLYHKEDRLYAEIRPDQLEKPFLAPMSIARGLGQGGHTLNFGEQWVLMFRRVGDKVHLVRRNVHFQAKKNPTIARAVQTTYADSVLMSLRIHAINPVRQSVLINLNDIFMTDFAQLGLGFFDASRSTWRKIKVFKDNIELYVAATYNGQRNLGNDVIDPRGTTVVVHYGLCRLPDDGYKPRLADDRVGYFLSVVKDFSSDNQDTSFVRYVNRWRLERAEPVDPKRPNKLSAPKKKIVFWIEKTVPEEYRAYVREGILEWNKAFEKIGFRDAIEVRQQENEDFDPEDINYNTFRWITNDQGYAMGPSRSNPLTGEILDADIVFDASMVRYYRQAASLFGNTAMADPISPIEATRLGTDLQALRPLQAPEAFGWDDRTTRNLTAGQKNSLRAIQQGLCQCGPCMKRELALAAVAIAARDLKPADKIAATDELVGQAIKEVVMHEVGHTLGLRHNFKASTMLKNEDLHNTEITHKRGLVASVMDYNPVNLAPKGVKQGDYFTTTIGPYDYWAIEYAYKPLTGGTDGEWAELEKIAAKSATPGHEYGTDEDLRLGTPDPKINVWDLGDDPMKYGMDRIAIAEELLKTLADKASDKGESYQKTRLAFGILLQQFGDGAHLIANFIGGEEIHRDHKGDPDGRDPFVPVKADKQREALKYLQEHILTDRSFQFSPKLLRRLGADRWVHWGNYQAGPSIEYPINERVLAIQRVVLRHVFSPRVLARFQNAALKVDNGDKPLTLAEVFRSLTDGIWADPVADPKDPKKPLASSVIRRNLQREHLTNLSNLVLGRSAGPADAKSLARMHLRDINKRIDKILNDKAPVEDTTRAHLEECRDRIAKALNASMLSTD
jgi:hypothetical protein